MKKGFTLFETLLAILIIAVLVTLAIPQYNKTKERIYDNQAFSDLKIIQMAEKGYHIDTGSYYPASSDIPTINNNLKLGLPASSSRAWNYAVYDNGCGQTTRNVTGGRTWRLRISETEPVEGGTCP